MGTGRRNDAEQRGGAVLSEQPKRLTDDEVRETWGGWFGAGADEDPLTLTVGASEEEVIIRADHLQAREDRRLLVREIRKRLCPDQKCGNCAEARALADGVDPQ